MSDGMAGLSPAHPRWFLLIALLAVMLVMALAVVVLVNRIGVRPIEVEVIDARRFRLYAEEMDEQTLVRRLAEEVARRNPNVSTPPYLEELRRHDPSGRFQVLPIRLKAPSNQSRFADLSVALQKIVECGFLNLSLTCPGAGEAAPLVPFFAFDSREYSVVWNGGVQRVSKFALAGYDARSRRFSDGLSEPPAGRWLVLIVDQETTVQQYLDAVHRCRAARVSFITYYDEKWSGERVLSTGRYRGGGTEMK